jgi:hypothetical protein
VDLVAALSERGPCTLELQTSVACPFSITLPPGFTLTGKDKDSCILGFCNGDGIGLTANNRVANLTIIATPTARATETLMTHSVTTYWTKGHYSRLIAALECDKLRIERDRPQPPRLRNYRPCESAEQSHED